MRGGAGAFVLDLARSANGPRGHLFNLPKKHADWDPQNVGNPHQSCERAGLPSLDPLKRARFEAHFQGQFLLRQAAPQAMPLDVGADVT